MGYENEVDFTIKILDTFKALKNYENDLEFNAEIGRY